MDNVYLKWNTNSNCKLKWTNAAVLSIAYSESAKFSITSSYKRGNKNFSQVHWQIKGLYVLFSIIGCQRDHPSVG